jgi:DNA-entry nuclease
LPALIAVSLTGCGIDTTKLTTAVSDGIAEYASSLITSESLGTALSDNSGVAETSSFDTSNLPEYTGSASVIINDNVPYFTEEEILMGAESFISLSELDSLGRCGTAFASVSADTMPTEERGAIGSVKPTGWHTVKYAGIDGNYLYNRCHLLMYALTGLNAEPKNLITGTRYLNIEGNLPYEESIVDYIEKTGNHVLYRVTPIFEGNNLLCSGELMEAYSVEDDGAFQFCVYCFNVQPGVTIDYATGDSSGPKFTGSTTTSTSAAPVSEDVMDKT